MGPTQSQLITEENKTLRTSVLFSVQRAISGEITPEMRCISVEISTQEINIFVFVDGKIDEVKKDDFDAVAVTQVVADFPYPDRGEPIVCFEFIRSDSPKMVEAKGTLVYARKEG